MSTMRFHGLALAASLVTLATGVVVGVGPLADHQNATHRQRTTALRAEQARLQARLDALASTAQSDQQLATELARPLTDKKLTGKSVLVVVAPGADHTLVRRVARVLKGAGATVTGTLGLTGVYVDPDNAQSPLEDLALRLVPPNVSFSDGARPIERVGTVLARATVTDADSAPTEIDQKAAEVIAGLEELKAITLAGDPGQLAQLAVVVAGPKPRGGTAAATGAEQALVGLVDALDRGSAGTVVLGSHPSAGRGGLVAQVRTASGGTDAGRASTIDTGGTVAGDVALVLALAHQLDDDAGDYGTGRGADALVPDLPGGSSGG